MSGGSNDSIATFSRGLLHVRSGPSAPPYRADSDITCWGSFSLTYHGRISWIAKRLSMAKGKERKVAGWLQGGGRGGRGVRKLKIMRYCCYIMIMNSSATMCWAQLCPRLAQHALGLKHVTSVFFRLFLLCLPPVCCVVPCVQYLI